MNIYVKAGMTHTLALKSSCCRAKLIVTKNGTLQLNLTCSKCRLINFKINYSDLQKQKNWHKRKYSTTHSGFKNITNVMAFSKKNPTIIFEDEKLYYYEYKNRIVITNQEKIEKDTFGYYYFDPSLTHDYKLTVFIIPNTCVFPTSHELTSFFLRLIKHLTKELISVV